VFLTPAHCTQLPSVLSGHWLAVATLARQSHYPIHCDAGSHYQPARNSPLTRATIHPAAMGNQRVRRVRQQFFWSGCKTVGSCVLSAWHQLASSPSQHSVAVLLCPITAFFSKLPLRTLAVISQDLLVPPKCSKGHWLALQASRYNWVNISRFACFWLFLLAGANFARSSTCLTRLSSKAEGTQPRHVLSYPVKLRYPQQDPAVALIRSVSPSVTSRAA
jgi:hypothetical protein